MANHHSRSSRLSGKDKQCSHSADIDLRLADIVHHSLAPSSRHNPRIFRPTRQDYFNKVGGST